MEATMLYSILLELVVRHAAAIPVSMGHLAHALFLNLVKQFDPALSSRLHDVRGYRPYTVSPLSGGTIVGERIILRRGQPCRLRITLLDGGMLWHALQTPFLEAGPIYVCLGEADFQLARMLSTPTVGTENWAGSTDWQSLNTLPAQRTITLHFTTATAFSVSERQFALYPEPPLIWESLLRVWNQYAPAHMYMEKQGIREALRSHVAVTACALHTALLHFPAYVQKGFVGWCTYELCTDESLAARLTTLAAFAHYAGIGYKTTMGMGQAHSDFGELPSG
jgi:CRISPR-associated endoribonuclease Cas6